MVKQWSVVSVRRSVAIAAVFVSALAFVSVASANEKSVELARWEQQAANVTIVRDDWGIAHITGKTDADTVFGMIYAQAEDDFNRVETNYLNSLGTLPRPRANEQSGAICGRKCSSTPTF